jgi:hypothetical protein
MIKALIISVALLAALCTPVLAQAVGPVLKTCTLTWDPLTVTDLKEYRVYVSSTPGTENLSFAQGPAIQPPAVTTTCAAQGITTEGQKYVIVTGVDLAGNQSARSNEVPFVLDVTAPPAVGNLRVAP